MQTPVAVVFFALALTCACGGHPKSSGPDCGTTVTTLIANMQATDKPSANKAAEAERLSNLKAVLANRCGEDKWSDEAQACMIKASTEEGLRGCWYKHLSQEQQDKLDRAASAVVTGKGPPGPPEHDTTLKVTGLDPDTGSIEGETYVRIKGNRFIADGPRSAKVYFGSRQGAIVRFVSDNELIVQSPGGQPNETVDVLIIFEPGGQVKIPKAFTFVDKR